MTNARFFMGLFLTGLTISCNFSEDLTSPDEKPPTHFALLEKTLFQASCISCHSATTKSGGVDLSSYEAIMAGRAKRGPLITPKDITKSAVYQSIDEGSMPPSGSIDKGTLRSLKCWIENGASQTAPNSCEGSVNVETTTTPSPTPSPSTSPKGPLPTATHTSVVPVYKAIKEQIIEKSCFGDCHNHERGDKYDLTTHEKILKYVNPGKPEESEIYKLVTPNDKGRVKMPPRSSGLDKLNQEQLDLLKNWITEGAKN